MADGNDDMILTHIKKDEERGKVLVEEQGTAELQGNEKMERLTEENKSGQIKSGNVEELNKRGFVGRQRLITDFAEKQPAMKQVEKDESKCQEVRTIPEERMEKKTMKVRKCKLASHLLNPF